MTLRNLFILNAILALGFGVGFVLIPGTTWTLYGLTPGSELNLAGQFFGVELIAVGLLCWFATNLADAAAQRAIMSALLVADVTGLVVSLIGTLGGVFNAMGWLAVVIYLVLSSGYGYFRFLRASAA